MCNRVASSGKTAFGFLHKCASSTTKRGSRGQKPRTASLTKAAICFLLLPSPPLPMNGFTEVVCDRALLVVEAPQEEQFFHAERWWEITSWRSRRWRRRNHGTLPLSRRLWPSPRRSRVRPRAPMSNE